MFVDVCAELFWEIVSEIGCRSVAVLEIEGAYRCVDSR